jgi:hypothetical protein
MQAKTIIEREAGGRLTKELCTDFLVHSAAFKDILKEVREVNEAKAAQEGEDRRMALREQARELQLSGKHARDDRPHDSDGDDVMDDAHSKEALDADWQQPLSRCRRTGSSSSNAAQAARATTSPTRAPSGAAEEEATPPATAQTLAQAVGPLATVARGRTQDRDRSPRRAKAAGTPAAAPATGTLQEALATGQQSAKADGGITPCGVLLGVFIVPLTRQGKEHRGKCGGSQSIPYSTGSGR